jgi:ATP-dependent protease ClpP protease subunit
MTRLSNNDRARLIFARIRALSPPAAKIHRVVGSDLFLNINGEILGAARDVQGVTVRQVEEILAANRRADRILVRINSIGGSLDHADAIRGALRGHGAYVTTTADQVCASAATLILMAGDFRTASAGTLLLFHEASIDANARWTAQKHRRIAQKLDRANARMTAAYAQATGKPVQRFQQEITNEQPMMLSRARTLNLIHCLEGEEHWICGRPHWQSSSPEEFISARFRDYEAQRTGSNRTALSSAVIGIVALSKLAMKCAPKGLLT